MSNKSVNFLKPKLLKKISSSKSPASTVSSSLYSGVASAEHWIQNPGPSIPIRNNQAKRLDERIVTFAVEKPPTPPPPPQYHPWELDYHKYFTRDTAKRSMTKDPYTPKIRTIAHANESITTEEECFLELIPADVVQINQPIIHGETKSFLPNIVRYVRNKEVRSLEQQMSMKQSSISQLQVETKERLPMIGTNNNNNNNGITLSLTTTDRLLNRAKIRSDISIVRRPPRKSFMDTIQETISPLVVYA